MIKANELRLGNLVYPDMSYPEPIKVCAKDFEDTLHLNPIPLTEEWLLKFGFVEIDTFDDHCYYLQKCDLGLDRSFQPYGIGFITELKHVHQLQNLYFALTGEELKIEL
jgi:hypothetical protein